jgi:hypothetical protein
VKKARSFRISGQARRDWENFEVPASIQDVVEGLFSLPEPQLKVRVVRGAWRIVHGRVEGRLFMMAGKVNAHEEWIVVKTVTPVWPPN